MLNTTIPACPRCKSDNTFVGIDVPEEFGCLDCGFYEGPEEPDPVEEDETWFFVEDPKYGWGLEM